MHGVLRNAGQMHSKCVYGMCYLSQNYKIVIMHLFEFLFTFINLYCENCEVYRLYV